MIWSNKIGSNFKKLIDPSIQIRNRIYQNRLSYPLFYYVQGRSKNFELRERF